MIPTVMVMNNIAAKLAPEMIIISGVPFTSIVRASKRMQVINTKNKTVLLIWASHDIIHGFFFSADEN